MKNNFIFIITFRNVEKYISECLDSVLSQKYHNYRVILIDDASSDNTLKNIKNHDKIKIIKNSERKGKLNNLTYLYEEGLNDEDILVELDGDDKLTNKRVLNHLNKIYNKNKILLTYGCFKNSLNSFYCFNKVTKKEFKKIRKITFKTSHLKTYKYKLFKEIKNQDKDLNCFRDSNNKFYTIASDVAIMIPMLEIAGFNKIYYDKKINYFYRIHDNNDHKVDFKYQQYVKKEIEKKPKFKKIKWD